MELFGIAVTPQLALNFAVAAAIITAAAGGLRLIFKRMNQGGITEQVVLSALSQWIYFAILSAEKQAQDILATQGAKLSGADKAKIANSVYDLIPAQIAIGKLLIDPRQYVSRELMRQQIENMYRQSAAWIATSKNWLRKQVDGLVPDEIERLYSGKSAEG